MGCFTIRPAYIPWVIDVKDDSSMTELGTLRGHIARQNPQAKAMVDSATSNMPPGTTGGVQLKDEVLVLFTSPVHQYVTPKFYTDMKPATAKSFRRGTTLRCKRMGEQQFISTVVRHRQSICLVKSTTFPSMRKPR